MALSTPRYDASSVDIWALGITIVVGGQYFSWNTGLVAGFYSYLGATGLMGFAYCCMTLCLAEISSALPFAGGAYGIARCSLGFYLGFMMGCCETLEYIAYVASSVLMLGKMVTTMLPDMEPLQPAIWLLVYATALGVHLVGGIIFWRVNRILAFVSLVIIAVYVLGCFSLNTTDLTAFSSERHAFDAHQFLRVLPTTAWFFVGIESLNLASDDATLPRRVVPRGQLACMATLLFSGILVLVASSFVAPGDVALQDDTVPFNNGFMKMFSISASTATLLSLPATFATIFGFIYSYSKLTIAIAGSQLLPPIFLQTWFPHRVHGPALVLTSSVGYGVCLVTYFVPSIGDSLFSVCICSAFCAYIAQCIGFIYLRLSFPHIERQYTSPLGLYGAVLPLLVWLLNLVSIAGFQNDGQRAFLAFLGMWAVFSVYYFAYAKARQTFSDDERKILFVAHIAIFNKARASNKNQRKKTSDRPSIASKRTSRAGTTTTTKSTKTTTEMVSSKSGDVIPITPELRRKSSAIPPSTRRKSSAVTVMIVPVGGAKGPAREIDGR
ncbi:hypothetical protein SDRG_13047 [Saprolegnia diclina VS20]|uniref:Amino acid permease/ SLC12A domain-containing protein n=1 Tax=Saprolegnia diclina (strain VS20) TaxID=1156394 RepID=T0PUH8_SAPDV|nr:hypothetical protein SDRG_13047 [Saprolegnia diclina VS20]EQC29174.1 hypothetical protein SDRG_13047 [Saprolegnia diclina VS20]|eukprot:XP_008617352.1 hypothetical protein SDRG_13047 [Saprolegnia diclina VS20]